MIWRYTLDNPVLGTLVLTYEPIGWPDAQIILKRDETLHGVVPEFSLQSFGFCCDGHDFIRTVYTTQGIEGRVGLLVEADCEESGTFTVFFRGILNLSTLQLQRGENVAQCHIEQDNPLQLVLNRIEVPVDLTKGVSVDGTTLPTYALSPFAIDIETGKTLRKRIVFDKSTTTNLRLIQGGQNVTFACNPRGAELWYSLGFPVVINEFETDALESIARGTTTDSSVAGLCIIGSPGPDNFSIPSNPSSMFIAPEDGNYCISDCTINWEMRGTVFGENSVGCNGANDGDSQAYDTVSIQLVVYKNTLAGPVVLSSGFTNVFTDGTGLWNTGPSSNLIGGCYDLLAGEAIAIAFVINFDGQYERFAALIDACVEFITFLDLSMDCCLTVTLDSVQTLTAATIQAFPPNEAFDRVIRSISENQLGVYSEYFGRPNSEPYPVAAEGCGARQTLTSGYLIRQFPIERDGIPPDPDSCTVTDDTIHNAGVFASLKELFDGYDSINNLGMGLGTLLNQDQAIRVEKKEFFYQDTVVLSVADIDRVARNFSREAWADRYWNEAEIGYADWQRDTLNGIDEFNTPRNYVTPLKTIRNKFARICQFIASGYTFETLRRLPFSAASTTGSSRNREGSSYDDNLFVVCVEEVLPVSQIEKGGVDIAGVLFPSEVYNWRISPYYNLRRWLNWLSQAALPAMASLPFWKVSKGEGNYKASGAETVQGLGCEFGDHIEDDTLRGDQGRTMPLLKPEKLIFDLPLKLSEFAAVKANPYGLIRLTYEDGTTEDAYLLEITYKPSTSIANFHLVPKNP